MSWVITGYQRMRRQNCDFNGSLDMRFKMKGRVDEDKGKLHLAFTNISATQSGTSHCAMVRRRDDFASLPHQYHEHAVRHAIFCRRGLRRSHAGSKSAGLHEQHEIANQSKD